MAEHNVIQKLFLCMMILYIILENMLYSQSCFLELLERMDSAQQGDASAAADAIGIEFPLRAPVAYQYPA